MIAAGDLEIFERSLRQATSRHTGEALDAALAEMGWPDALAVDGITAISTLFALQGAANATSSALDLVLRSALGLDFGPATDTAVVLPALASWAPPGERHDAGLTVKGLGTAALGRAAAAVVTARTVNAAEVAIATVDVAALTVRSVGGMDPAFGLMEVNGDSVPSPAVVVAADRWHHAVALAQLAVGHELVGAARAMLDLARQHALNRVQFGQPISRFQAVRHRLAETLVAIEGAEAVLVAAGETGSVELCAAGKALAGRGAQTAARHCQQVLAGIGFTAEHPFHRYFRRVLVLDQLFGTARALTDALGHEVLAGRRLPDRLPL